MDDSLVFSLSGSPRGKGRPRTSVRGGFAKIYTDADTRAYERSVGVIARQAMGPRAPFEGPLSASLRFRLPLPKSMTKRRRASILAGEEAYLGSLDIDNMAKAILDGMNAIAFLDDVQIVRLFVTKIGSDRPGVDVKITPL